VASRELGPEHLQERLMWYKNKQILPDNDRIAHCAVCGFAGNPDTLSESEVSITRYITAGTTYDDPDASNQDLEVDSTRTARSQCQLCGTPRVYTGRPGDLKKV
jgi:hypothetical protein